MNSAMQSNISLSSNLPLMLKKLLCRFVGYFNGEIQSFKLDSDNNLTLVKTQKTPLLLIVARSFYTESAKQYPLENKTEVKKLLKLEYSQHENTFSHVWGLVNGQNQVNIWQFNEQVPKTLIQLPESVLFALSGLPNQVTQVINDKTIYVTREAQLIHSLPHSALVNSCNRFAMSVGVAQQQQDKHIVSSDIATELVANLKKLTPELILSFISLPKSTEGGFTLFKKITIPSLTIFSLYLTLSSGYLFYKHWELTQDLTEQGPEISSALQQQLSLDKNLIRYHELSKFLSEQNTSSEIWLIMEPLFSQAEFSNVSMKNDRYILSGNSIKAIDLLEVMSKMSQVENAKFDRPIRQYRGKDIFVISFKIKKYNATTLMQINTQENVNG